MKEYDTAGVQKQIPHSGRKFILWCPDRFWCILCEGYVTFCFRKILALPWGEMHTYAYVFYKVDFCAAQKTHNVTLGENGYRVSNIPQFWSWGSYFYLVHSKQCSVPGLKSRILSVTKPLLFLFLRISQKQSDLKISNELYAVYFETSVFY